MKKVLFIIHDLSIGGAEKVLVNLVNNMDKSKFDVTVLSLFGGGVNEQFLNQDVRLVIGHKKAFRGNSHVMKLLSPKRLYRRYIKEDYDVIVSYLEGPCARIASGCTDDTTKLVSWIHGEQHTLKNASSSFRSADEALKSYNRFDRTICVSQTVKEDFKSIYQLDAPVDVLYNTVESDEILSKSQEEVNPSVFSDREIKLIGVGKVVPNKGFDRLARIHLRLRQDGYPVHTYIMGVGHQREEIERFSEENNLADSFTFLGYDTNPYKYVKRCDLFVCSSFAEGFSTAATEALIVGTPVCTVEVSGMKEMLGENNEYGIVTKNDEQSLYQGIKKLLDDPKLLAEYKQQALIRGKTFSTENTVKAVEDMLMAL